ncbi:circularly permuted type 2 ATP-grasp protein [Paraliomyxa miuraensis]|uniref:circularly permuted type 2 ATP-grasp protein n=1 Tax=Paraliomyxa miuraensis TaxID=376150 RepID=UPI002B1CB6BB|nr:circularly permuted type 2 ATP-grasp protein [Paraliomyxa miuraensis]
MEAASSADLFASYQRIPGAYDEIVGPDDRVRGDLGTMLEPLVRMDPDQLAHRADLAALSLINQGVTFSVYSDSAGSEKVFPFCPVPRMLRHDAWARLERGLVQRLRALELFLDDVYGAQTFLTNPRIDPGMVLESSAYMAKLHGIKPAGGVRVHVGGIDLIRGADGGFAVLEDNLRCPSGVSYVLQNRVVSKRVFPEMFRRARVRRVDTYPARLAAALTAVAPCAEEDCCSVVLTPGSYNSAYFEHTFLARTMGIELVEASDLLVDDDRVYARTTAGPQRVHSIYRRTDETFLDPEVFRPDSLLGVPGIIRAYAAGNVVLANAPGNGIADDKGIYPLVPEIIRHFLGEEPLLAQVPTYMCARQDDRAYVLEHLHELVVKLVDGAGGYGMLMGPQSTADERDQFRARILAEPRRYIAQPLVELSTTPTWIPEKHRLEPRRVDLRPYVITSPDGPWVLRGGLTRTALVEGSYVVNSSQGGGSKDTWVLEERS